MLAIVIAILVSSYSLLLPLSCVLLPNLIMLLDHLCPANLLSASPIIVCPAIHFWGGIENNNSQSEILETIISSYHVSYWNCC